LNQKEFEGKSFPQTSLLFFRKEGSDSKASERETLVSLNEERSELKGSRVLHQRWVRLGGKSRPPDHTSLQKKIS